MTVTVRSQDWGPYRVERRVRVSWAGTGGWLVSPRGRRPGTRRPAYLRGDPLLWVATPVLWALAGCASPEATEPPYEALSAVFQAEDNRSSAPTAALLNALVDQHPQVRAAAYRALGRHERPDWAELIAPGFEDSNPDVRVAAVVAIGDALSRSAPIDGLGRLEAALEDERHPRVRGALAQTAARMSGLGGAEEVRRVEAVLAAVSSDPGDPGALDAGSPEALVEPVVLLARGYEQLSRRTGGNAPSSTDAAQTLAALAEFGRNGPSQPAGWATQDTDVAGARVRRLALAALSVMHAIPDPVLDEATSDPDAGVRVVAANAILQLPDLALMNPLWDRVEADASFLVRYAAVTRSSLIASGDRCEGLLAAARDGNDHVGGPRHRLLGEPEVPGIDRPPGGAARRPGGPTDSRRGLAQGGPCVRLASQDRRSQRGRPAAGVRGDTSTPLFVPTRQGVPRPWDTCRRSGDWPPTQTPMSGSRR